MDVLLQFKSYGKLIFDPGKGTKHFDPNWALLLVEEDIPMYYGWILKKYGIPTLPNKLWNAHISVIKGEECKNKKLWDKEFPLVEFWYSNIIRWHHKHAWIDVFSPEMSEIREKLGLLPKCFFHLTIGLVK